MIPFLQVRLVLRDFGRGRWSLSTPLKHAGYTVFSARPKLDWVQTVGGTTNISTLAHRPRDIYCAWREGRLVASRVIYCCGGYAFNFKLLELPTRYKCSKCEFYYKRGKEKEECSQSPLFLEPW